MPRRKKKTVDTRTPSWMGFIERAQPYRQGGIWGLNYNINNINTLILLVICDFYSEIMWIRYNKGLRTVFCGAPFFYYI